MKTRKILAVGLVFLTVIGFVGCSSENESETPKTATYNDVEYERAFLCSGKDGLRSRFSCVYLFNEDENKVQYLLRTTAGGLKIRGMYGTYEGNLNEKVEITWEKSDWEKSDPTTTFEVCDPDKKDYWSDGVREYEEVDVVHGLYEVI